MTSSTLSALLLVVAGAAIGLASNYLIERHKERAAIATRWDDPLRLLSSDFAAAARELLHLSRRLDRSLDQSAQREQVDDAHLRLRSLNEQIRLLGDHDVQLTAQLVVHHAYAVRAVIGEKKPDERFALYGIPVDERYLAAVRDFYKAVRRQLRVKDPEDLASLEVAPGDPWAKTRESGAGTAAEGPL